MPSDAGCRCDRCKAARPFLSRQRRTRCDPLLRRAAELAPVWWELEARERIKLRRVSPELVKLIEAELKASA